MSMLCCSTGAAAAPPAEPQNDNRSEPLSLAEARTSGLATAVLCRIERREKRFSQPFPNTNGRSCATCHVPDYNFTLSPAHVKKLRRNNPKDPLFNAINADDPKARKLTLEHLKKGFVRVWLTLPDNIDVANTLSIVTTPHDRRLFVWRTVPSLADVSNTAPFQLDGRAGTIEEQTQAAITSHSKGGAVSRTELELIAEYERSMY